MYASGRFDKLTCINTLHSKYRKNTLHCSLLVELYMGKHVSALYAIIDPSYSSFKGLDCRHLPRVSVFDWTTLTGDLIIFK